MLPHAASDGATPVGGDREFLFTDEDFQSLSTRIYAMVGITLPPGKKDLVYTRLARRLRALGLDRFSDYCAFLESAAGDGEREALVNQLTTNHTAFFREAHHFDHLREAVIEPWTVSVQGGGRSRLRLWSAACSTGEEPYSIALAAADILRRTNTGHKGDLRILATDIDTDVLATAQTGVYGPEIGATIPAAYRGLAKTGASGAVSMAPATRALITFKRLNLLEDWPMRGPFDAIFCRNVMIYFDNETKHALASRLGRMLSPDGYLYIGHAEHLDANQIGLEALGRTIYRKARR
ncbi:MAG: CheR family methyltransferase [Alphaproteobacteria bacterium]